MIGSYRRLLESLVFIRAAARLATSDLPQRYSILWGYLAIVTVQRFAPTFRRPIRIGPIRLHYGDLRHLRWTYREIFIYRLYDRDLPRNAVRIVDGGANIGLAALFYSLRFPQARIDCYEPDDANLTLLRANIAQLPNVHAHAYAIMDVNGTCMLYTRGLPGDSGVSVSGELRSSQMLQPALDRVSTIRAKSLGELLPVDVLKLDIEGAEAAALQAADLRGCRAVHMEFHPLPDNPLSVVISSLERDGFSYTIAGPIGTAPGSSVMIYAKSEDELGRLTDVV